MHIAPLDLNDKKRVRDFLGLPFRIYADIRQWVPPLQMDERLRLNPKRAAFYQHSAAAFFLAYESNRAIGRIAALDNRPYNEFNHEATAFFYLFECENNLEAATALFNAAFDWARARGLNKMLGPKGFTPLDGFGLLVKGFEHRPSFGLPYNPAYYVPLVEAQGFTKISESVSGYLSADINFPPRIHELTARVMQRRGLRIATCTTKAELRAMIPYLKELYNHALGDGTGGMPISDADVQGMADSLLWIADPKLVKIVMKDDKAVGFLLAYPDISAAIQQSRGRLFPFGWIQLLLELRRTDWINVNGAGLLPEYRGSGGTAILFSEMYKSVTENPRYRHADVVQIDVANDIMQREMENFGIDFNKTHRVVAKNL